MRRGWVLVCWLASCASLHALSPPAFYLSDDAAPRKQTVELTIDPSRETFTGSVQIDVDLRKPSTVLWLNAKNLNAKEATVTFDGQARVARVQAGAEFLGLELDAAAGPGPATISINYQGRLDEKGLAGVYRRKVEGNWYAYTTFTPIDARRAFPCFDEPRFKTPWEISIHVRRGQRAFSNGRELTETDEAGGWKLVRFAVTEPLPAEVVAFAVGPFDVYQGASAGHDTAIRVITTKNHAAEGRAAAQATSEVLPRLEAYTGMPYAFGKLDHLALPEGTFGAVENPGLITYREAGLLIGPGLETPARTRAIRELEAHEIGHQWFGDLVTQATWADVWLSEGFATWLAAKVMDQEQAPERAHLASIASRERMMVLDSSRRTRPVRVAINDREAARGVYNRVVYDKGSAILLMLEGWLGEDHFQDGLRKYLQEHRFGNASTEDLAADLRAASGTDPLRVMQWFLDSTGVPQVRGEVRCEGDAGLGTQITLRITKTGPGPLPVCWRAGPRTSGCNVLDGLSSEIALPVGTACPAWLFLNAGGTGYYRSEWSGDQRLALPNLTPAERLTLVYDLRGNKTESARRALQELATDTQPEIAAAARDGLR
jgi:alanyl aminopeptidase